MNGTNGHPSPYKGENATPTRYPTPDVSRADNTVLDPYSTTHCVNGLGLRLEDARSRGQHTVECLAHLSPRDTHSRRKEEISSSQRVETVARAHVQHSRCIIVA